jgi:signal transduction histidine kinase
MPEIVWYRSLYWRIALGFVALLATLLVVQGLVFLWLTGRTAEFLPGRSPAEFANTIAADLSTALSENPALDIDAHLNGRYNRGYRAFAVARIDGPPAVSRHVPPPPNAARAAQGRLMAALGLPDRFGPPPGRMPPPDRGPELGPPSGRPSPDRGPEPGDKGRESGRRGDGPGRRGGGGRAGPGGPGPALEFAPVIVNAAPVAMVAVPVEPPPLMFTVRQFGPALGAIAVGLLVAGTAIAALLIFRPSQRRLRSLQEAARAVGAGATGVRASETGGDEVASLARAFNEMAGGLEERSRALVTAHDTRRQLLADVSHELMTPLAAIRGYVETMSMADISLDEDTKRRYLKIVSDETERLEHIIGDLLDLARLEGGGGTWKREPVSVAALFDRVQNRHEPILRDKGIRFEQSMAPDAATVEGDANRLEQALQNLAANAVRHTPSGGRVKLSADRIPAGLRIVVEDSGAGIPPEHLPRLFDRFYKVDVSRTGTTTPSGSGLGLSIVQAIVERHGGTITASNVEGGGARFEIVLS